MQKIIGIKTPTLIEKQFLKIYETWIKLISLSLLFGNNYCFCRYSALISALWSFLSSIYIYLLFDMYPFFFLYIFNWVFQGLVVSVLGTEHLHGINCVDSLAAQLRRQWVGAVEFTECIFAVCKLHHCDECPKYDAKPLDWSAPALKLWGM